MAYTSPADIRSVLGSPTDPSTAASLPDETLQVAADEAQAEVDATLAGRFAVPFDEGNAPVPVPPLVASITRDIAAFLATMQLLKGSPIPPTHPVLMRWQRATGLLKGIANGNVDLALENDPGPTQPTEQDPGATVVNAGDYPRNPYDGRLFTREGMGVDRTGRVGWRYLGEDIPY